MNADISTAADKAKNTLDWLRDQAPYYKSKAAQRLLEATTYISREEALGYIPTFTEEINKTASAAKTKRQAIQLLITGAVLLFLIPPIGIVLLLIAGAIFLRNRQLWLALEKAEAERSTQLNEIKSIEAQRELFETALSDIPPQEVDESLPKSLDLIASDLKRKYSFLDVACRDLNSNSLTWNELAMEILGEVNSTRSTGQKLEASFKSQNQADVQIRAQLKPLNSAPCVISFTNVMGDWHFEVSIDQARSILSEAGYKRLPREWLSISNAAEEKICKRLASDAGINSDDFYWRFEEGHVKAEKYS